MITTLKSLQNKFVNDPIFARQFITDANLETQFSNFLACGDELTDAAKKARQQAIEGIGSNLLSMYYRALQSFLEEPVHKRYPLYVRVPFSEDTFDINTETRTIKIPKDFSTNGVGVVGDHLAEFLWFKVDRFYDMVDLMYCDINITWRNTAVGSSNSFSSSNTYDSAPYAKYCDNEHVYFGWYITETASVSAGTIEFAIRFSKTAKIKEDDPQEKTVFSLYTQPAKITIKSGLVLTSVPISDNKYDDIVRYRPIFSEIINYLDASEPILVENLDGESYDVEEELENGTKVKVFTVTAYSPDNAGLDLDEEEEDWVEITDDLSEEGRKATITFSWYWNNNIIDTTASVIQEAFNNGDIVLQDGQTPYIQIKNYRKGQLYKTVLTTGVPGSYKLYVGNKIIDPTNENFNGIRYVQTMSPRLEEATQVQLLDTPMIKPYYYIGDTTVGNTPEKISFGIDFDTINGLATYTWYKDVGSGFSVIRSEELTADTDVGFIPTNESDFGPGHYYAKVQNYKNNMLTTATTSEFSVINPPRALTDELVHLDPDLESPNTKFTINITDAPVDCKYRYRAILQKAGNPSVIKLFESITDKTGMVIDLTQYSNLEPGQYFLTVYAGEITCPGVAGYERYAMDERRHIIEGSDSKQAVIS